ncbi:IS3 family transposase [Alkalibacterium sp. AK22]|uniref:IS3 family transposase n=1 Tax=Alkalibacterium sp. AK22 TaxID=1229520 RepID=UPI003FA4C45A
MSHFTQLLNQKSSSKSEEFQYIKFNSLTSQEVTAKVGDYRNYYNNDQIQEKLDYYSPLEYGGIAV